jgi:hypothetical protein
MGGRQTVAKLFTPQPTDANWLADAHEVLDLAVAAAYARAQPRTREGAATKSRETNPHSSFIGILPNFAIWHNFRS